MTFREQRRRRRKRRKRPRKRLFPLLRIAISGLLLLVCVNASVRALGGDVGLLTCSRFSERAEALLRLAVHLAVTPFREAAPEPLAALHRAAAVHGVPSSLVVAVATVESGLVPTRISGTGAMGLMQLMPRTADALGVVDPFDVQQNAQGGARYLKELLATFDGNVRRALAAYNAGPTRVSSQRRLPSETHTYVARVLALHR